MNVPCMGATARERRSATRRHSIATRRHRVAIRRQSCISCGSSTLGRGGPGEYLAGGAARRLAGRSGGASTTRGGQFVGTSRDREGETAAAPTASTAACHLPPTAGRPPPHPRPTTAPPQPCLGFSNPPPLRGGGGEGKTKTGGGFPLPARSLRPPPAVAAAPPPLSRVCCRLALPDRRRPRARAADRGLRRAVPGSPRPTPAACPGASGLQSCLPGYESMRAAGQRREGRVRLVAAASMPRVYPAPPSPLGCEVFSARGGEDGRPLSSIRSAHLSSS